MAMFQGQTIVLLDRVQTGEDPFHMPVYTEIPVQVDNVVIFPVSSAPITTEEHLKGKQTAYQLLIPKEDAHIWEDRCVEFWGERWETTGIPEAWMEGAVPGPWNKRVEVTRYG